MMDIRIFLHPQFRKAGSPEILNEIVKGFRQYKTTGIRPKIFGRDEAYDRPWSVLSTGMRHIHIRDDDSRGWDLPRMRVFDMTSDTALVYCQGFSNKNAYLLLDLLSKAHSYYRGGQFHLLHLADLAEEFQKRF